MTLSVAEIVILVGAVQGFFLSVLVFHKYKVLYANRFLAALMLCYSMILVNLFATDMELYARLPAPFMIFLSLPFVIGPLHYSYALFLIRPAKRIRAKDALHLLPYLIYSIYFLMFYNPQSFRSYANYSWESFPLYTKIFNGLIVVQCLIYMAATWLLLHRYAGRLSSVFSNVDKIKLDWLRHITLIAGVNWLVFLLETILMMNDINLSNFTLSSGLLTVVIYATGYMGLFKSDVFLQPQFATTIGAMEKLTLDGQANDTRLQVQKYEKSGLTKEKAAECSDRLVRLMEEDKIYRQSDLTLPQLAETLGLSAHNLSEIINMRLNKNFFDFVNHYRVEEVKSRLGDSVNDHLKILAIAFDAGFNSKSSFNTIFKKHTGLSPSAFREVRK